MEECFKAELLSFAMCRISFSFSWLQSIETHYKTIDSIDHLIILAVHLSVFFWSDLEAAGPFWTPAPPCWALLARLGKSVKFFMERYNRNCYSMLQNI